MLLSWSPIFPLSVALQMARSPSASMPRPDPSQEACAFGESAAAKTGSLCQPQPSLPTRLCPSTRVWPKRSHAILRASSALLAQTCWTGQESCRQARMVEGAARSTRKREVNERVILQAVELQMKEGMQLQVFKSSKCIARGRPCSQFIY